MSRFYLLHERFMFAQSLKILSAVRVTLHAVWYIRYNLLCPASDRWWLDLPSMIEKIEPRKTAMAFFFIPIITSAFCFYCFQTRTKRRRRYSNYKGTRVSETLCEKTRKRGGGGNASRRYLLNADAVTPIFSFFNCVDIQMTANNILYYNVQW